MDTEMSISEELQSKSIAELESRLSEVDAELVEYQALEKLVAVGLLEARLKHESSERALENLRMQVITLESQIEVRKKTHEQDKERIRVRLSTLQQHLETVKLKRMQLEDELSKETKHFDQESSALGERIEKLEKEFSEAEVVREDMINALKENDHAQIWAGRIQSMHTRLYGSAQPKGVKLIKQLTDSSTSKFIEELAAKYGDSFSAPLSASAKTTTTTTTTSTATPTSKATSKATKTTTSPSADAASPKVNSIDNNASSNNNSDSQAKKPLGKRFRSTELDTLIRDHALAGSLQHATFQDTKQTEETEEYIIEPIVRRTRSSNSRSSEEAAGEKQIISRKAKSKKDYNEDYDEDEASSFSDDSSAASTKAVKIALDKPVAAKPGLKSSRTARAAEVVSEENYPADKSARKQNDRSMSASTRRQASQAEVSPKDASPSLSVSSTTPVKKRRRRMSSYVEEQDEEDDDDDEDSIVEDKRRRKRSKSDESSKTTPTTKKMKGRKRTSSDASSAAAAAGGATSSSQKKQTLHWTQELKQMKKERENKDYSKVTCSECPDRSDKEDLILCDRCDQGYHLSCANITEIPNNWFICKYCKAKSAAKTKQARRDYERRNYYARRERQLALKKQEIAPKSSSSSASKTK